MNNDLSDPVDPDAVGVTYGAPDHAADPGEPERLERLTEIIRSSSWSWSCCSPLGTCGLLTGSLAAARCGTSSGTASTVAPSRRRRATSTWLSSIRDAWTRVATPRW